MTITLLTDFGTADYYVSAMKGAILSGAPDAQILDITHEIEPQDVEGAAFVLEAATATFPPATIHVAVVDPGVGSERRPIIVAGRQVYVGPDNGLFTFVYDADPTARVVHITEERFFRRPVSRTFHGRDIFAPVAAALAKGTPPATFGVEITDPTRLTRTPRLKGEEGVTVGRVLHIDRFGNCVTNLLPADLPEDGLFRLRIGDTEVVQARGYYGEGGGNDPFVIAGSAGYLEISVNGGSASQVLDVSRGTHVSLWLDSDASFERTGG